MLSVMHQVLYILTWHPTVPSGLRHAFIGLILITVCSFRSKSESTSITPAVVLLVFVEYHAVGKISSFSLTIDPCLSPVQGIWWVRVTLNTGYVDEVKHNVATVL